MSLSPTAARALEQVKMGLYMLRGADYFSEEEWIKIDALVHKGQYVFTNGPQNNVLEEELINFDDTTNDTTNEPNHFKVQISTRAFEPIKEETIEVSERQILSPTMSDRTDPMDSPTETPNITSAEASSDDEASPPKSADADSAQNALSAEPVQILRRDGLSLYTQAQLDEVKAFNSGLTKAGQKSKPGKYSKYAEHSSAGSQSGTYEPPAESSPTPTEQATHSQIQTWASDVQTQDSAASTPTPEIVCPGPTKVPSFRPLTSRPMSRISHKSSAKSTAPLPTGSTMVLGPGRPKLKVTPGTVLIAQRSCPKKSLIQLEIRSGDQIKITKHVSGITHTGENMRTRLKGHFTEEIFKKAVESSDTLIQEQRSQVGRAVSGNVGVIGGERHVRAASITNVSHGLERIEGMNAAAWEEDGFSNLKTTSMAVRTKTPAATAIHAPNPKLTAAGLGASRFADEDESVKSGSESHEFQGMSKEEVGQLIDQKFAQILAVQTQRQSTPTRFTKRPAGPRSKASFTDPLKKVNPKTSTCWFWATPNKECRFTADECRDLHAYLPPASSFDPPNLRMGKPNWGALADAVPTPTTTTFLTPSETQISVTGEENAVLGANGQANVGFYKNKTCWYWANDASGCTNSAEDCKYLHARCPQGIANRPTSWKRNPWNRFSTNKESGHAWTVDGDAEMERGGSEDGDLVLEEVTGDAIMNGNGHVENVGLTPSNEWGYVNKSDTNMWAAEANSNINTGGWGSDPNKYKPPHIKALEEKALIEAVGW